MKKVYIPTEEELNKLKNIGINPYYYLLTKTIESIIMADVIYEEEDMFEVAYDEFSDYPQIIYSIAKMYPERIKESSKASNDIELCQKMISTFTQNDKSIYGLDQMKFFKEEILKNKEVLESIITTLSSKLHTSPRYRFEYEGPNDILDEIFACEIDTEAMATDSFEEISAIDPIYIVKKNNLTVDKELVEDAIKAIIRHTKMYGLHAYGVGYTSVMANKTDKLTRRLEHHKKYYNL